MRVPADHLVDDGLGDVVEGEGTGFFGHPGMEDDLEEEVPQFVPQVFKVPALDGVGDLVGLFHGVGRYGLEGLLQVPGAASFPVPELRHDGEELADRGGGLWHGGRLQGAI